MGFLQGLTSSGPGRSARQHMDLMASIARADAQTKMRERQAKSTMDRAMGLLPAFQGGDPRAQMELATMGLAPRLRTPEEVQQQNEQKAERARQIEEQRVDKEMKQKQFESSMGLRREDLKLAQIREKRAAAADVAHEKRFQQTEQRAEKVRVAGVRKEFVKEQKVADEEVAAQKSWRPLIEMLYPEMAQEERDELMYAAAEDGAPSPTDRSLAHQTQRNREEKSTARRLLEQEIRHEIPEPEYGSTTPPPSPKQVTEEDIQKRFKKQDKAEQDEYEEQVKAFRIKKDAEPVHMFQTMPFLPKEPPFQRPLPRVRSRAEIATATAAANEQNLQEWQRQVQQARQQQQDNEARRQEYEADIQHRTQVATELGALGLARSGLKTAKTPEERGEEAYRTGKTKAGLERKDKIEAMKAHARSGDSEAQSILKDMGESW